MRGDRYVLYSETEDAPRAYLLSETERMAATIKAEGIAELSPTGTRVVVYDGTIPLFAVHLLTTQPSLWYDTEAS